MRVIVLEAALEDLAQAIHFFESQREGLGLRFRRCVEKLLAGIIAFPRLGALLRKKYRVRPVPRFRKYGILYRIKQRTIFIHGVIHLQRGPRLWRERLARTPA